MMINFYDKSRRINNRRYSPNINRGSIIQDKCQIKRHTGIHMPVIAHFFSHWNIVQNVWEITIIDTNRHLAEIQFYQLRQRQHRTDRISIRIFMPGDYDCVRILYFINQLFQIIFHSAMSSR